ncbi:sensor histidine kinase [Robertmurraya korlensis]|uniref:sensor histidine kinase n=1 Tax=Robertmurraya korlensis TaxID=519977 RepID=UPI0008266BBB|nr:histidine kinase [Robertmurraya korlensis]
MKKIRVSIANFYKSLKLNAKLFITITLIMLTTLAFVLGGLQYAFSFYDEQLYTKSSQVLMMSSNTIEKELDRVEEVSYNIAVDPQIQRILSELQADVTGYDFHRLQQEIEDELAKYIGSENYIQSINLYDSVGREFLSGSSSHPLKKEDKNLAFIQADKYEGENHWLELVGYNGDLISARLILSYEQLSFEKIGKLLIRVNLNKIVSDLPKPQGEIAGNIVITQGNRMIFSEKEMDYLSEYTFLTKNMQGYSIENIKGERTFINHITTNFDGWTYWSIIPFDRMFAKITAAKYTLLLVFMIMFVFLITIGFTFLRKLTNPILDLATTMQEVQNGDFNVVHRLHPAIQNDDEIGILYRNFKTMIQRIDELIQENFSKQLLIKETEFRALQAQINPHFLYNTLESINWLAITRKQEQISKMVESLGHLMRNSLNFKEDIILFEEELDIVNSYLTIQKYRFDDRFDMVMDIPDYVRKYRIPKLIIQPLLENTFKHAVEPSIYTMNIKLSAFQEEDKLYIQIEDNGPGIDPLILQKVKEGLVKPRGTGIGLNNIDDRIKLYAGEHYGLRIENLSGNGTAITVVLPVRTG